MCCALSAQESLRKHCEKTACRDACKGHQSRKEKKDVTSSGSQAGVKSGINKSNTFEASMSRLPSPSHGCATRVWVKTVPLCQGLVFAFPHSSACAQENVTRLNPATQHQQHGNPFACEHATKLRHGRGTKNSGSGGK